MDKLNDPTKNAILLVKVQFMYMARPNLHVKERFFDALVKNIRDLKLSENLEVEFLALAIKAFGSKLEGRQELCSRALDILERIYG